jgi:hypothetical protein
MLPEDAYGDIVEDKSTSDLAIYLSSLVLWAKGKVS